MSVRKDKNTGRWIAIVEIGTYGDRKRKTKRFKTKAEAVRWEREITTLAQNADMNGYDITLEALAKQWLEHKKKTDIAESTMVKYVSSARVLETLPIYKEKARDIRTPDIEEALHSLVKKYTLTTIRDIKKTLSSILYYGVDKDYLVRNTCSRAKLPSNAKPGRDIDCFSKEELAIIESHKNDIPFGDIVYILLNTGLRSQEVCCINRDSIYVRKGIPYIRINKALSRKKGGGWEVGTTKTPMSTRDNPISKEVYKIILERCIANKSGKLLEDKNGNYISYETFANHYKAFFKTLNEIEVTDVTYRPPHCCRHTFASRCKWSGVDVQIAQELLGHASLPMTYHYTHTQSEDKEIAVRQIQ